MVAGKLGGSHRTLVGAGTDHCRAFRLKELGGLRPDAAGASAEESDLVELGHERFPDYSGVAVPERWGAPMPRAMAPEASSLRAFQCPLEGSLDMKKPLVLCVALCISLSTSAAFARGGHGGSHHSSSTGGAAGTSVGSPGTNSAGTALSSGGGGNGAQKGPLSGTNPVVDREEAKVDKMIKSICRGC